MKKVLVAISGGVDSAVSALLLKESGHIVEALYIRMLPESISRPGIKASRRIASHLGIKLHIVTAERSFEQHVISYFTDSYSTGLTPNPCVVCNYKIKFKTGLDEVTRLGMDLLATGHYARIKTDVTGTPMLLRGTDKSKDQSYFLTQISLSWLTKIVFPIGHLKKNEVKEIARQKGLLSLTLKESQEICFLRGDYRAFLRARGSMTTGPGPIVTKDGRQIGTHKGLEHYTIGQRRGLNIPDKTPYYVIGKDMLKNILILGKKEDLFFEKIAVDRINWLVPQGIKKEHRCLVQIRYRHKAAPCTILPQDFQKVFVHFDEPQPAPAPGQFAVFYQEQRVLGGGVICEPASTH